MSGEAYWWLNPRDCLVYRARYRRREDPAWLAKRHGLPRGQTWRGYPVWRNYWAIRFPNRRVPSYSQRRR